MRFGSDFDFRRHILTGRARVLISEHQNFGVRAIRGWSGGALPPQRLFAIGGIGSVHGYEFKERSATRSPAQPRVRAWVARRADGDRLLRYWPCRSTSGASLAVAERCRLRRSAWTPSASTSATGPTRFPARSRCCCDSIGRFDPRLRRSPSCCVPAAGHARRRARRAGQGRARARVGGDGDDRAARRAARSLQENARRRRHPAPARAGRAVGKPAGVGPPGLSGDRPRLPLQAHAERGLSITDPSGATTTYTAPPRSMPVVVDLGDTVRLTAAERYYVHVVATIGTLAEREVERGRRRGVRTRCRGQPPRIAGEAGVPDGAAGERLPAERVSRDARQENRRCGDHQAGDAVALSRCDRAHDGGTQSPQRPQSRHAATAPTTINAELAERDRRHLRRHTPAWR